MTEEKDSKISIVEQEAIKKLFHPFYHHHLIWLKPDVLQVTGENIIVTLRVEKVIR